MVVTSEVPTLSIGVTHERVGTPLTCTVQAPQSAMPQPNFVPVRPITSRSTHRSGVSGSTSTVCILLLTLMVNAMACLHRATLSNSRYQRYISPSCLSVRGDICNRLPGIIAQRTNLQETCAGNQCGARLG